MEQEFSKLAKIFNVPIADIWKLCELCRCQRSSEKYYHSSGGIRKKLGENKYILLLGLVGQMITSITRTSFLIENLNCRIKPYFELRKQMGRDFNESLRFFINHTPLFCSRQKERQNKTSAELLMKLEYLSWLEMLWFKKPEICQISA